MADEAVQPEKRIIEVAHAMPGRVRLRIADKKFAPALAPLAYKLRLQNGIYELCKHQESGSLIVSFNSIMLPFSGLLEELEESGVVGLTAQITEPLTAWKKQSESILPVIVGLLLTRDLKLFE